jgi:hypothetical protein
LLRFVTKIWWGGGRCFPAAHAFRVAVLPVALAWLFAASPRASGSVGVVLNESLHESMDRITGTGHTAVYFSNICADSPVKLRLCQPGELGSVMSTYVNIGEDQSYGWNIVPLSIYLYGVEDPAKRPIFASYKVKRLLEERYRDNYLTGNCVTTACRTSLKAEWREMVAATLIRSIYIFAVDTTVDQDRAIIAGFNDAVNKNNFNGVTRNCADFTKHIINTYFPHAVSRDFLNDFGMTSPKAVARTFTHYAMRHPESNFRVMHFAQVTGTIQRSSEVRAGTEQLYRSKKLLVPMVLFADHELPFVAASYLLTGRFNPEHEFEKYPAAGPSTDDSTPPPMLRAAASPEERQQIVGSSVEWKEYKSELNAIVDGNKAELDPHDLSHFLKRLDRTGTASIDSDGSVWMEVVEDGEPLKVGVSANNALASGSNPHLSYKFLLARTAGVLKSPKHSRETMLEFRQDWDGLQRASSEISLNAAIAPAAPKNPTTVPAAVVTAPNF